MDMWHRHPGEFHVSARGCAFFINSWECFVPGWWGPYSNNNSSWWVCITRATRVRIKSISSWNGGSRSSFCTSWHLKHIVWLIILFCISILQQHGNQRRYSITRWNQYINHANDSKRHLSGLCDQQRWTASNFFFVQPWCVDHCRDERDSTGNGNHMRCAFGVCSNSFIRCCMKRGPLVVLMMDLKDRVFNIFLMMSSRCCCCCCKAPCMCSFSLRCVLCVLYYCSINNE